jgi:hypothetical protein
MHANTYFYLVNSQADWDDLVADFLPAAASAAIDVWLYFVPPSECPATCTLPFEKDYIRIAADGVSGSVRARDRRRDLRVSR